MICRSRTAQTEHSPPPQVPAGQLAHLNLQLNDETEALKERLDAMEAEVTASVDIIKTLEGELRLSKEMCKMLRAVKPISPRVSFPNTPGQDREGDFPFLDTLF
jgi:hypothetical protein